MTQDDDPLAPDERRAFDALPHSIDPAPDFEQRVIDRLRAAGVLRPRRRLARLTTVAAMLALLVGGFALGRIVPTRPPPAAGDRYLLLLYGAPSSTPDAEAARVAEYSRWARQEADAGRLLSGEKLDDAAVVLGDASRQGQTDPSGFFLIRAGTAADARAIASRCPHLRYGGTVVVRRIAGN